MHDVTGIIADNFQLLIPFKFMPNYDVYSSLFIHAKVAVAKNRIYCQYIVMDAFRII